MTITIPFQLRAIQLPHAERIARELAPLDHGRPFTGLAERLLFLCFTNRCGSNYLAQLLASTGAFGEAGEFFNAETVLEHARRSALASLRDYVRHLPSLVSHDGWIAAKAGIDQLIMLADAGILQPVLERSVFVLIERKDRLGQAISRVIASQNGRWTTAHASPVPDAALRYDSAAIAAEMDKIELANFAFYRFFAANGIAPVHLTYESVVAKPQSAVDEVTQWVGLGRLAADASRVRIGRQAGAVNAAWRARFLAG